MRIALLTGEYPPQPGGVGDYTHQLGLALSAEGCRVAILTIRDGRFLLYDQLWDSPSEPEQPFVALQPGSTAPKLSWSWRCWPYVWTAVQAWRPDWLHIQYQTGAYAMQAGINLLPRYLRLLPERPRIAVTFHDLLVPYLFPKAGRLRTWVNRRLATDAEAVITTNAGDASQLAAMKLRGPTLTTIPIGSNIAVAPPSGYQRAAWRTQLGVAPSELLVAYFGLLSQSKGVDLLIEALAQLGPGVPWRLLLIGGTATAPQDVAYAAEIAAQIARLGLAPQVIRTGHLEATAVSAHLLAADCAVLPFRDGASLRRGSLLAALAHGCPLITTSPNDPDAAALLCDGQTAILVPPEDSAALATAMCNLIPTERRNQLGAAGQAAVAPFSWPQIARQHTLLYSSFAAD